MKYRLMLATAASALLAPSLHAQYVVKGDRAKGQEIAAKVCAACHGPDGGGLIGPNLTDSYWIHGAALDSVYNTVANGVLEKGMPPWGKVLKPQDVERVVAYITTLRGTTPANPKAPQGVPVTP